MRSTNFSALKHPTPDYDSPPYTLINRLKRFFTAATYREHSRRAIIDYDNSKIVPSIHAISAYPPLALTRIGLFAKRKPAIFTATAALIGGIYTLPVILNHLDANSKSPYGTVESKVSTPPPNSNDKYLIHSHVKSSSSLVESPKPQSITSHRGTIENHLETITPTTKPLQNNTNYVVDSVLAKRGDTIAYGVVHRYFDSTTYDNALKKSAGLNEIVSLDGVAQTDTHVKIIINHGNTKDTLERIIKRGETFRMVHNRVYRDWINRTAEANGLGKKTDTNNDGLYGDSGVVAGKTIRYPDFFVPSNQNGSTVENHKSRSSEAGKVSYGILPSSGFRDAKYTAKGGAEFKVVHDRETDRLEIKVNRNNELQTGNLADQILESYRQNHQLPVPKSSTVGTNPKDSESSSENPIVYNGPLFDKIGEKHTAKLGKNPDGALDYDHGHILKGLYQTKTETTHNPATQNAGREFRLALARELLQQYTREEALKHNPNAAVGSKYNPPSNTLSRNSIGDNFRLLLAREVETMKRL